MVAKLSSGLLSALKRPLSNYYELHNQTQCHTPQIMTILHGRNFPNLLEVSSIPSVNDYWKQRLYDKLTQVFYNFPIKENSKRKFYDTISNDKIQVIGKELNPGNRGIESRRYFKVGSNLMDISTLSVSFCNPAATRNAIPYIKHYQQILAPFAKTDELHETEVAILNLSIVTLFNYLEDAEFAYKINNLCTHHLQIKCDKQMCRKRDKIKKVLVQIMLSFFVDFHPALVAYKRGNIKIAKCNWKFLENFANLIFINCNTLVDYKFRIVGYNLDPQFSMINHSCMPNSCQVETEYGCYRLINTLPINAGDEITVNYIASGIPTELRQVQLFSRYFFRCKCPLCNLKCDIFFTMQCNSCFNPIKSPSLSVVLSAPNTIIRETSCSKCCKQFDNELYIRQFQIRNFFIALIYSSKSYKDSEVEAFVNRLHMEFKSLTGNFGTASLVKMLDRAIDDFCIPEKKIETIKILIDEVMRKKVFQIYTFPFNLIVQRLLVASSEVNDFKTGMEYLKLYARYLFAIKLPTDISNQLLFNKCLYLDLADGILQLLNHLKSEKIATCFGSYQESMEILAQCAFFFYKQVDSLFELQYVEEKLISIREEFRHSNKCSKLSIHSCLEKFFTFTDANIYSTRTRFLIFNAKQKQVTLLHTFDSEEYL